MRFRVGDCLSLNISTDTSLAGLVSSTESGRYEIAITDYRKQIPPSVDYFNDCILFTTKFELAENSFSALDVITIDFENRDIRLEKICHLEIPGFLPASGFQKINNTGELISYFESGISLRDKTVENKNLQINSFETKCFININEFLKSIPKRSEFSTVKLYKELDGIINYWQVYGSSNDPIFLMIHSGVLGETGKIIEIKDQSLSEIRKMYNSQIMGKKVEEYSEPETLERMILQFPVEEGWGAASDLEFRNEIWEHLDKLLFWTGNGSVSGGDIGSGRINLFFEVLNPNIAIETIVQALEQKKIAREYIIAIENNGNKVPADNLVGVQVLYPKNYKGSFFY